MNSRWQHIRDFVQYDLWRHSRAEISDRHKRVWYKVLQTVILVVRGFRDKDLNVRANALTYSLLFAIVPIIAVMLAIARGFGFEQVIEMKLNQSFLGETNLVPTIMEWVDRYLETAQGGVFIGVGLVVLLWAVYSFFRMVETSFNEIWNVRQSRSFGRQFVNYLAILFLVPVLMIVTSGLSFLLGSAASNPLLLVIEPLRRWTLRILPFVVASGIFTWMYIAIPNTKVHFVSAVVPGVLVGVLFQLIQMLSTYLMMFFTRTSVVYGAFAAIPLVLIWLHISCLLLIVGAELGFAIQNNEMFAYERDLLGMSRRYKDYVMLYLLTIIVHRFEADEVPLTAHELAQQNRLPIRLVLQLLSRLEEVHVVREVYVEDKEDTTYVPALDTHRITVGMVLDRVSAQGTEQFLRGTPPEMQRFWQRYQDIVLAHPTMDEVLVSELAAE